MVSFIYALAGVAATLAIVLVFVALARILTEEDNDES